MTEPARHRPESFRGENTESAKKVTKDERHLHRKHTCPGLFETVPGAQVGTSLAVLMDNIRSAWNVGSIFRSADGFGFAHAYLCGITPTPESESVTRTALGAEDTVTWSYHKDAVKLAKGLKKEGWQVWALEEDESSRPIVHVGNLTHDTALIVGNEVTGVDPGLLDLCDDIFHIPMRGVKSSFNVAVAFGIAAFALGR